MMSLAELVVKMKVDDEAAMVKTGVCSCGSDSLITKSVKSSVKKCVMSSVEVVAAAKCLDELEDSDVEIEEKRRELSKEGVELVKRLEVKVGALKTLLLAVMSTNKELRLKVGEMSVELDLARKVKARHATAVVEMGAPISHFGNVANYVHLDGDTQAQALASACMHQIEWVIDSGASKHVTGLSSSFKTYSSHAHSESVQIVDATSQPVHGVGSIECTPSLSLASVLHVPSFPVNLLFVSSLINQFKCTVTFDETSCVFQERGTGRRIGTGIRRNGLWFINHGELAMIADAGEAERKIMLLHCRLGHPSFDTLNKLYPESFKGVDRSRLVCDACELEKHTRSTYPSIGLRNCEPFMLIHSDV